MKEMTSIFFQALAEPDFHDFRNEVKEVFSIAIAEHFGLSRDGNFFEDDDIDGMLRDPKSAVYAIYVDGCFIFIPAFITKGWADVCGR